MIPQSGLRGEFAGSPGNFFSVLLIFSIIGVLMSKL